MLRQVTVRWLAVLVTLATALLGLSAPAWADEDQGMCHSDHSRGTIPKQFPLKACFDGTTLYLLNDTQFPLSIVLTGNDVSGAQRYTHGQVDGASRMFDTIRPGDFGATPVINGSSARSGILPPNFYLKSDMGDGEAKVSVDYSSTQDRMAYFVAEVVWRFIPLEASADVAKTVYDLSIELGQVGDAYSRCLERSNGWGDLGCELLVRRNIAFAYGRAGVNLSSMEVAKSLVRLFETSTWFTHARSDAMSINTGAREFTLIAKMPVTPTTPDTGQQSAPDPAPVPASENPPLAQAPKPPPAQAGEPAPPQKDPAPESPPQQEAPPASDFTPPASPDEPPASATATVENKHLDGATALTEDSTPSYLSSEMQPYCASNGCKLDGTDMVSGDTFTALCWDSGATLTNENRSIPDDDSNPNRVDSDRWLKGQKNGQTGFISFIYLDPASRALHVSHC